MYKNTTTKHSIKLDATELYKFDSELKKIIDKMMNPEYIRAMEKLAEICSKQNYLYN